MGDQTETDVVEMYRGASDNEVSPGVVPRIEVPAEDVSDTSSVSEEASVAADKRAMEAELRGMIAAAEFAGNYAIAQDLASVLSQLHSAHSVEAIRAVLQAAQQTVSLANSQGISGSATTQLMMQLIDADELYEIRLSEETMRRIQIRADVDLTTREGLRAYFGTFDDMTPAQADIATEDLLQNAPELLERAQGLTREEREAGETRAESWRELARQISASEEQPVHIRELASELLEGDRSATQHAHRALRRIRDGEQISETDSHNILSLVNNELRDRDAEARRAGVTTAEGRRAHSRLSMLVEDIENNRVSIGVHNDVAIGLLANGTYAGNRADADTREAAVRQMVNASPTFRTLQAAEREAAVQEILRDASNPATRGPLLTQRSRMDVMDTPGFQRAMEAGYTAMRDGNLEGAIASAERAVAALRAYGVPADRCENIRAELIRGAHAGSSGPGHIRIQNMTAEEAIASMRHLIETGEQDATMDSLLRAGNATNVILSGDVDWAMVRTREYGALHDGDYGLHRGRQLEPIMRDLRDNLTEAQKDRLDLDNDGYVALYDVVNWMRANGFRTVDANHDGEITTADVEVMLRQDTTNDEVARRSQGLVNAGWDRVLTDIRNDNTGGADVRADGRITAQEIRDAARAVGVDLNRFDVNQNGLQGDEVIQALREIQRVHQAQQR